jgi:hypothetical protein
MRDASDAGLDRLHHSADARLKRLPILERASMSFVTPRSFFYGYCGKLSFAIRPPSTVHT